jgi:hypothetical protein
MDASAMIGARRGARSGGARSRVTVAERHRQ